MPIYNGDGTIFYDWGDDPSYTDAQCVSAFMAEVNKKALSIGMSDSEFVRPAGDSGTTQTTVKDMALLTMIASSYKRLAEIWSKNSYSCIPRNKTTAVSFNSTVQDATLEASYPILGGKTGSVSGSYTLACLCDVNGKQVVGYTHGSQANSTTDRFGAMKELMDICATILGGGTSSASVTKADEAIAILVPNYFTANYEQQSMNIIYQQSPTTQIIPASTVKVMTAVTALDWIDNINDTFTFVQSDMIGGSGSVFSVGDIISYKDALYAMMLPSSNQSAQAIARVIGRKILTKNPPIT